VLEDRGRIERLMGIAQHLQLPSALAPTPSNASTASTMSSRTVSHSIGPESSFKAPVQSQSGGMLGSSIFRMIGMGSSTGQAEAPGYVLLFDFRRLGLLQHAYCAAWLSADSCPWVPCRGVSASGTETDAQQAAAALINLQLDSAPKAGASKTKVGLDVSAHADP
jgi:hypothetical protein